MRTEPQSELTELRAGQSNGKPTLIVRYKDGSMIVHLFGANRREIATFLRAPKHLTNNDVLMWQGLYRTSWRSTGKAENGLLTWKSRNGLFMTFGRFETYDAINVFDFARANEILSARVEQSIAQSAPEPVYPKAMPLTPAPKPAVEADQNNCLLIVATEAHARLKKTNCWSRIAAFGVKDDEGTHGHAAVFFLPDEGANVFNCTTKRSARLICTLNHTT